MSERMPLPLRLPIVGPFLLRRMQIVSDIDPERLTIGQVADLFCCPRWYAYRILRMGVTDGAFSEYWSVVDWKVEPVYRLTGKACLGTASLALQSLYE